MLFSVPFELESVKNSFVVNHFVETGKPLRTALTHLILLS